MKKFFQTLAVIVLALTIGVSGTGAQIRSVDATSTALIDPPESVPDTSGAWQFFTCYSNQPLPLDSSVFQLNAGCMVTQVLKLNMFQ